MNDFKPHFTHDCSACQYHGHMQGYDVYIHFNDDPKAHTYILRYSSEGSNYYSITGIEMLKKSNEHFSGVLEFING